MEQNHKITAALIKVVENQINSNDPPETKQTYERLLGEGFSAEEATKLIGGVVIAELFDVMAEERQFDLDRYVVALNRLPVTPE